MKPKIIIIAGPTAVGKTSISVKLAKELNGEIVSADSVQIYKGADIGSAKVTKEEMAGIPHHLLDFLDINRSYSAGDFVLDATKAIDEIIAKNKVPIIVGGTGLYINSLLFPLTSGRERDEDLRIKLLEFKNKNGNRALWEELNKIDPESAKLIHYNQTDRILRAIEIYKTTGKKKSELTKSVESKYDYLYFVLNVDRDLLYSRINQRVDIMINDGLVNEVKGLIEKDGLNENSPLLNGIGYREIYDYLTGKTTLDEAINLVKQHSRNYAKRQLTWFKKAKGALFVEPNFDNILAKSKEFIYGRN